MGRWVGMSTQPNERTGLTINWLQIAGGALAAITSAVALAGLKSLGTYGTLVGAAVGSIAASTAAAIYNHYLNASRERLADAARRARERRTGPVPTPQDDHPDPVDPPVVDTDDEPLPGPVPVPGPRRRFRGRHAVLLGAAAFVLSVGGIFVYEQASGTSVAAERGGTTVSEDGVSSGVLGTTVTQAPATPVETQTPTSSPTDTATETSTATESSSTDDPSATSEATSTSTETSTSTSSPTASRTPAATPSASATATSDPTTTDGGAAVQEDSALGLPTGTPTAAP